MNTTEDIQLAEIFAGDINGFVAVDADRRPVRRFGTFEIEAAAAYGRETGLMILCENDPTIDYSPAK